MTYVFLMDNYNNILSKFESVKITDSISENLTDSGLESSKKYFN